MPTLTLPMTPGGPLIDVFIAVSRPRAEALKNANMSVPMPVQARCLIDTGASGTALDGKIIQSLGLTPSGTVQILTPSTGATPHSVSQYDVGIILPFTGTSVHVFGASIPVMESDFSAQGIDGLIGRDVLSQCVITYNGPACQIIIAV